MFTSRQHQHRFGKRRRGGRCARPRGTRPGGRAVASFRPLPPVWGHGLAQTDETGDTLVVWRLDRLGRSLAHLIQAVTELQERGVHFRSLEEQLDTSTSGKARVVASWSSTSLVRSLIERDLTSERTMAGLAAGLAAARARGRRGGRPGLSSEKVRQLRTLAADRSNSVHGICETLGISRATFYRYSSDTLATELHRRR